MTTINDLLFGSHEYIKCWFGLLIGVTDILI